MARTISLSQALNVARATRNAFNYWHREGVLSTGFADTTPGVARALNHENTLELAFMAAATTAGLGPKEAKPTVGAWLWHWRRGALTEFVGYESGRSESIGFSALSVEEIAHTLGGARSMSEPERGPALVFTIINLGEIARRVAALFAVSSDAA